MPWYFYLAFKQLFPSGKLLSFFTVVSVCGVMLGVMLLVIVQSVMNGFGEEIRSKIIDTSGHIRIEARDPIRNHGQLLETVESFDEVEAATPYAQGMVMVQKGDHYALPAVRGIDPMREGNVVPIERYLLNSTMEDLYDDGAFLSSGLASALGARVGSFIEVYTPLMLERITGEEVLLPRELEVLGIFNTGWHQVDDNTMVVTLRLMQDLYDLEDGVHGVTVRLQDGENVETATARINEALGGSPRAFSWIDANRDFLWILQLEKNVLFFLLLFIIIVAAFAITSSLLITVVRKTKEIGLLGALGGRPRQIAACFCFQGFFIGVVGTALGVLLAVALLYFRNQIVYGFAVLTQSRAALERYYEFTYIPLHYSTQDFIVITVCSVVISTLAGMIPALRAARLKPTEAFRNE